MKNSIRNLRNFFSDGEKEYNLLQMVVPHVSLYGLAGVRDFQATRPCALEYYVGHILKEKNKENYTSVDLKHQTKYVRIRVETSLRATHESIRNFWRKRRYKPLKS